MSMAENDYFSVRFVPQPISSVCFVPSNRYCLIVAYENTGMVVLFNLKVRSTFSGSTVVEVTVCHGHSDFVSINYFDRILYYTLHRRRQLWETCRCPGIYWVNSGETKPDQLQCVSSAVMRSYHWLLWCQTTILSHSGILSNHFQIFCITYPFD